MHKAIFTIVERGRRSGDGRGHRSGRRGGTIINARGSESTKPASCSPWKSSRKRDRDDYRGNGSGGCITSAIRESMRIDEPGRGIIFTAPVSHACGLY